MKRVNYPEMRHDNPLYSFSVVRRYLSACTLA
nr:MAG TPA: hypothetical protein [Caudoviricetes sp.]